MTVRTVLFILVAGWVAATAASFLMAQSLDGPRNLDMGLRRLEVFLIWQAIALMICLASALLAWRGAGLVRRDRVIGLIPLALTALSVLALIVVFNMDPPSPDMAPDRPITAPAEPATG